MGGYWPVSDACGPGQVEYGPQGHTATGSYWWCVSFGQYIFALTYVYDLHAEPGTFSLAEVICFMPANNCTTEAEEVVGCRYTGITPCLLSAYLNGLPAPTCSCSP
jgi:hypothetical protein